MLTYLARRLLFAAALVFIVSSAALLLVRAAPGDMTSELVGQGISNATIARQRALYGLDRSVWSQYVDWVTRAARLDLGTSLLYGRPVGPLVAERAMNTAILAAAALFLATSIGLPLGVWSGAQPGGGRGALASVVRGASFLGVSLPPLITSLALAVLAARTGWLPVGGFGFGGESMDAVSRATNLASHLIVPALALAVPIGATLERLQAHAMADALGEPCIAAALARGIPRTRIVWRHALRLSAKPVAAVYGLILGSLLSGSFVVELVSGWPGLGRLLYDALYARDLYLVAGCAAAGALMLAFGTLLSDVALARLDPRLREPARTAPR